MALLSGAQATAECFKKLGVKRVYGLIGTSILDLIDALYNKKDEIRYISVRHEQTAVSMADAEGRLTGRPGVAVVHAGPGFLNGLIGVGIAYKDSSPLLLMSGGVRRRLKGYDVLLEVDQERIVSPITKGVWRVKSAREIPKIISEAFSVAITPPKGPVMVEVPEDVWPEVDDIDIDECRLADIKVRAPSEEDVIETVKMLKRSSKPLILAGGGINNVRGSELLIKFVEKYKIPVITTGNGRGVIPEDHPLSLGRVGFGGGSTYADRAFEESDFILALGCQLSDVTTYSYTLLPKGDVVIVTLDERAGEKPGPYTLWSKSDAYEFLKKLSEKVGEFKVSDDWLNKIRNYEKSWMSILKEALSREREGFVNPAKFFKKLDEYLPSNSVITAGQGMHVLYAYAYLKVRRPRGFLVSTNLGAMGFGLPAALAAGIVEHDSKVVAILGDGEFMMTLQDLETAVRERIPVKIVVVNDYSYRVLWYRQKLQKMGRIYGSTHLNPDFARVAEIFGASGYRVNSNDGLDDLIKEFLREDEPSVIDLIIDPEDLPPLNIEASLKMTQF